MPIKKNSSHMPILRYTHIFLYLVYPYLASLKYHALIPNLMQNALRAIPIPKISHLKQENTQKYFSIYN